MFFTTNKLKTLNVLEDNWRQIKDELEALNTSGFTPWNRHEGGVKGAKVESWTVFPLFHALEGRPTEKNEDNCALCPTTVQLLQTIPGITTAGFSRLQPGSNIKPHRGLEGHIVRVHLGLITPPGCALNVGGMVRPWRAGRCLAFDDTVVHEAWNRSKKDRVVLLLDVERSALGVDLQQCREPWSLRDRASALRLDLKYKVRRLQLARARARA